MRLPGSAERGNIFDRDSFGGFSLLEVIGLGNISNRVSVRKDSCSTFDMKEIL